MHRPRCAQVHHSGIVSAQVRCTGKQCTGGATTVILTCQRRLADEWSCSLSTAQGRRARVTQHRCAVLPNPTLLRYKSLKQLRAPHGQCAAITLSLKHAVLTSFEACGCLPRLLANDLRQQLMVLPRVRGSA